MTRLLTCLRGMWERVRIAFSPRRWYCNKCGRLGDVPPGTVGISARHAGCDYSGYSLDHPKLRDKLVWWLQGAGRVLGALLLLLLAPIAEAGIRDSIEPTVERMAEAVRQNQRDIVLLKAENLLTRVTADAVAWRIGTGSWDVTTTGWFIAEGGSEGNIALGGSRNNALIILGTKLGLIVVEYVKDRRSGEAYKACVVREFERYTGEDCDRHLRSIRNRRNVFSGARILAGGWNSYQLWRQATE